MPTTTPIITHSTPMPIRNSGVHSGGRQSSGTSFCSVLGAKRTRPSTISTPGQGRGPRSRSRRTTPSGVITTRRISSSPISPASTGTINRARIKINGFGSTSVGSSSFPSAFRRSRTTRSTR